MRNATIFGFALSVASLSHAPQEAPQPDNLVPIPGVENPRLPTPPAGKKWLAQEGYEPKAGDRLQAYDADLGASIASIDSATFVVAIKANVAEDSDTAKQLLADKKIAPLANGTSVEILRREDFKADGKSFYTGLEVKVIDGPYRERTVWVFDDSVGKLRLADAATKPPVPPVDPEKRAETLLKAAQNLEKAGKVKPAIENYREIVAKYPKTPAARKAAERLKVLAK